MTDQHPLTDDKCYELWSGNLYENEKMRAAADWQLDQVVEWLRHNLHLMPTGVDYIVGNLREAMRPQQQQENN